MCHTCELNADTMGLPLRERVYLDDHRRVSHGWSALPGWLCVALRRHAEALDELTPEEAEALGPIIRAASVALKQSVSCEKTYVMLFTEHPRYPHLHLHIVPRMSWFGENDRSAAVFRFLTVPEAEHVSVDERERLAAEVGQTMRSLLA